MLLNENILYISYKIGDDQGADGKGIWGKKYLFHFFYFYITQIIPKLLIRDKSVKTIYNRIKFNNLKQQLVTKKTAAIDIWVNLKSLVEQQHRCVKWDMTPNTKVSPSDLFLF